MIYTTEELNRNFRSAYYYHSQLRRTSLPNIYFSLSVIDEQFEKLQEFLFVSTLREERADI